MSEVTHRTIETNGIRMHIAEQGEGPLVLLCHGFPESWYSWRNQLRALADAGFRAVAPDMRGYGQTDAPAEIEKYTLLHVVGDMVGVLDALGAETAAIAGHDWGAPVAWHAAQMRPDLFRGVIGLSVPFRPRGASPPTAKMPQNDEALFYQLYFQAPGVAEAELERDPHLTIRASAVRRFRRRLASSWAGRSGRHGKTQARILTRAYKPTAAAAVANASGCRFLRWRVFPNRLSRRIELVSQHRSQLGATSAVRWTER
jgi:pimeloyl-ACP methyl ester carboxylesterase